MTDRYHSLDFRWIEDDGDLYLYVGHDYFGLLCPHQGLNSIQTVIDGRWQWHGGIREAKLSMQQQAAREYFDLEGAVYNMIREPRRLEYQRDVIQMLRAMGRDI